MANTKNTTPVGSQNYPTREAHTQAWEELAQLIVQDRDRLSDRPPTQPPERPGSLTILGSGIQGLGFTMDCQGQIEHADRVFYCVSNPPTQVWLRTLRPDAMDLYVFYDDTKPRYHTYVQMSEAILYHVRRGERVVCIFYGHPGIFVLSTHRAIAIARREGHRAVMKAGISALDCLCADLGVDPSYPGMQTYEATEMLVRGRRPDPSVHVVLWQVGLIGETGYRRKGFVNDNFPILVEYLQAVYGEHYEITHYIAARHATFDPVIAVHKLSEMLNPQVRSTFTGISTFYIPPKVALQSDAEMARRLGFLKGNQRLRKLQTLRQIALYSQREMRAVDELADYKVPGAYQFQTRTRPAEFLASLSSDAELARLYVEDPVSAVKEFGGMSRLEAGLLASRNEDHAQIAAKGKTVVHSPNEHFVIALHQDTNLTAAFRAQLVRAWREGASLRELDDWIDQQGFEASASHFASANARHNAMMILPWTGVYRCVEQDVVLTIIGSPHHNQFSQVYVNLTPIHGFTFNNRMLAWRSEDGNPTNGVLLFHLPRDGDENFQRRVTGRIWQGEDVPVEENLVADEVLIGQIPVGAWSGAYRCEQRAPDGAWGPAPAVTLRAGPGGVELVLGEERYDATYRDSALSWPGGELRFSGRSGEASFEGHVGSGGEQLQLRGRRDAEDLTDFSGTYSVYRLTRSAWGGDEPITVENDTVQIGGGRPGSVEIKGNTIHWTGGRAPNQSVDVRFQRDPITGVSRFVGHAWGPKDRTEHANMVGLGRLEPSAMATAVRCGNDSFVPRGPDLVVDGVRVTLTLGEHSASLDATLDAETEELCWAGADLPAAFEDYANARIALDQRTSPFFRGQCWPNGQEAPERTNWIGAAIRSYLNNADLEVDEEIRDVITWLSLRARHPGTLFIWSQWQRARLTGRTLNALAVPILKEIENNHPPT